MCTKATTFSDFIMEKQPLAVICGHIHEGVGVEKLGETTVINPGSLGEKATYAWLEVEKSDDGTFKVTKAEIINAIHNPLGVHTVTGIKYRTRTMMGRCQGGYCQMRITEFLESELGIPYKDILYERKGSYIFTGTTR